MRTLTVLILMSALVIACGASPPAPAAPTRTAAPVLPSNTATSRIPPTFTPTPTLLGGPASLTPSFTPLPTNTFLLVTLPTGTPEPSSTAATVTPSGLEGTGFNSLELSADTFYWGSCDPGDVTMSINVDDPANVLAVVVFVRFRNKATGNVTGWDQGSSMEPQGGGAFRFVFDGDKMGVFYNTWVNFQFVGTNGAGANVARSPVFLESLTLSPCP